MISKNKYLKINNFYKRVDPDRPNWVRLYGRKNYREFLRIITRHSTSMRFVIENKIFFSIKLILKLVKISFCKTQNFKLLSSVNAMYI